MSSQTTTISGHERLLTDLEACEYLRTGAKPFVTWGEIFGRKFTDEFRASTIGAAINDTWFDGRAYWLQIGGVWRPFKKPDISIHLRVAHAISDTFLQRVVTVNFLRVSAAARLRDERHRELVRKLGDIELLAKLNKDRA